MNERGVTDHMWSRVKVTTRDDGVYVGVLESVFEDQRRHKLKGKVRIDGYLSPAAHSGADLNDRNIPEIGEVIECDASIIEPSDLRGMANYLALLDAKVQDLAIEHADFVSGRLGATSDRRVQRQHGWCEGGITVLQALIERTRTISQNLEDRVSATIVGDQVKVVLPMQYPEIMRAVASLGTGKRFRWVMSERAWIFPFDSILGVMSALGNEEISRVVHRKLSSLTLLPASGLMSGT